MSFVSKEFRSVAPLTDLNQVISAEHFIKSYWDIDWSPPAVGASYPLRPIRRAINHFLGEYVKLSGNSSFIPDALKDLRTHELRGVIKGPLTYYIENIEVTPHEYAPRSSAVMNYDGRPYYILEPKPPAIFLKFLPEFRDGYAYINELEMKGAQNRSKAVVEVTLPGSLRFIVKPTVIYQAEDIPEGGINKKVMAEMGIVALQQMLKTLQSAITTGIAYVPNYYRGS